MEEKQMLSKEEKQRAYNKKYKKEHPEKIKAQRERYKKRHPEKIKEDAKRWKSKWYAKNKDRLKEEREANKEKYKEQYKKQAAKKERKKYMKEYLKKRREAILAGPEKEKQEYLEYARNAAKKYRALKRGVTTEKIKRLDICRRDNWICGICHKKVDSRLKHPDPMSPSLDHIIPLSQGGTHSAENLQLTHLVCNLTIKTGGVKQMLLPMISTPL